MQVVGHLLDAQLALDVAHQGRHAGAARDGEQFGAGAAGLAALLAAPETFAGRKIGLVLCGGNIDTRLLANVLLRDLVRSGRLARLRIRLKDRPGQLFAVARVFDQQQVNILEVSHQRIFTNLPAKGLITDIECEARDGAQIAALVEVLRRGHEENALFSGEFPLPPLES